MLHSSPCFARSHIRKQVRDSTIQLGTSHSKGCRWGFISSSETSVIGLGPGLKTDYLLAGSLKRTFLPLHWLQSATKLDGMMGIFAHGRILFERKMRYSLNSLVGLVLDIYIYIYIYLFLSRTTSAEPLTVGGARLFSSSFANEILSQMIGTSPRLARLFLPAWSRAPRDAVAGLEKWMLCLG